MKHESPPTHMDVNAFAQSSSDIHGADMLSKYERLMMEAQGQGADRMLTWAAKGELLADESGAEQVWLHLTVDVSLPLTCQRCLGPVDVAVAVNRSFRFVGSEEAADAQDENAEEDLLVLSKDFNLQELIEDEVLLELPVISSHGECPVVVKLAVVDPGFDAASSEKLNPFAVLAKLKSDKLG